MVCLQYDQFMDIVEPGVFMNEGIENFVKLLPSHQVSAELRNFDIAYHLLGRRTRLSFVTRGRDRGRRRFESFQ